MLYVNIKHGYEFIYNAEAESHEELLKSDFGSKTTPKPAGPDFVNSAGMEQIKAEIDGSHTSMHGSL